MKGFRDLLRMSVEEFNDLLERVTPQIIRRDTHLRKFRIGSTTLSRIVMETCAAITLVLREEYLKTPSTETEWKVIAKDFEDKWHFPHCIGAIDGKHIFIQPPANSGSTFYNYKSRFSIILMAVVDTNYRFVYASAGTQGRASDAGVFAHSDLREAMDTGTLNVPPDATLPGTDSTMPYELIGDEAYPLRPDLMKPYPSRNLNHDQRISTTGFPEHAVLLRTHLEFWPIAFAFSEPQFACIQTKLLQLFLQHFVSTTSSDNRGQMPTHHLAMWILKMQTISWSVAHGEVREPFSQFRQAELGTPQWMLRNNVMC
uniref:DDE Tnp4 domain-containing protein n=1 Tax=Nothobranchius kadleci TaxID=1051664 RepID=A0A1A8BJ72_NOTKA